MNNRKAWLIGGLGAVIGGLLIYNTVKAQKPVKAEPVTNFNKEKYLGKWYEIARFDYRFEKNMNNVTAEYSLRDDGKIRVFNRGYDTTAGKFKSSTGKAKFRGDDQTAALKVSFFGPFYAGYNVIAIDKDYQYALVAGENLDYLWILSRTTSIPENIKQQYLKLARSIGYMTEDLIWVEHNQ